MEKHISKEDVLQALSEKGSLSGFTIQTGAGGVFGTVRPAITTSYGCFSALNKIWQLSCQIAKGRTDWSISEVKGFDSLGFSVPRF